MTRQETVDMRLKRHENGKAGETNELKRQEIEKTN